MALQAARRQLQDDDADAATAARQLLAEREAQIERLRSQLAAVDREQNVELEQLRAQLAGFKDDRDLEIEALTEERDRLDAALAVCAP